jgi:hypothetical protein
MRSAMLVALLWSADASAQAPTRDELLDRATMYVQRFVNQFSNVVADEHYVQETTVPRRRRVLFSEFLMVKFPGATDWYVFRDVSEVDGKSVRTEEQRNRLSKLFLETPRNALTRAREIAEAGARYNLWDIGTLNNPLLSLTFLQLGYRDRFRFNLAGLDKKLGPDVRTMQFQEFRIPTLLKRESNNDLPARGLVWIQESTGGILQTELRVGGQKFPVRIVTRYAPDEELQINVPVEMSDWYPDRQGEIRGVATYGRFRRFQVRTEEEVQQK